MPNNCPGRLPRSNLHRHSAPSRAVLRHQAQAVVLALASFHKCDFLLTWNCQHLANANKFAHIRRLHAVLGLHVPLLVTPLELMEDPADEPQ